ncbi:MULTISPECIES: hypothetical protein [Luteimonas]|uniref:hypothetical protein n=1 Tax=Luteimonas TaxID=83614 RepID=UPI000C798F8F|nr:MULTISPECIES: hypothetical protein [Luteimonas]
MRDYFSLRDLNDLLKRAELEMSRHMRNFKSFAHRKLDVMEIALYLYFVAAIAMAVFGIDLTGLVNEALLPDQARFQAICSRNPALDYMPSLFFGMLFLYVPVLLANLASFRRRLTWTSPSMTPMEHWRLSLACLVLGAGAPLMLFLALAVSPATSLRTSAFLEFASTSDLTVAAVFFLTFWISTFLLAGAYFNVKLALYYR